MAMTISISASVKPVRRWVGWDVGFMAIFPPFHSLSLQLSDQIKRRGGTVAKRGFKPAALAGAEWTGTESCASTSSRSLAQEQDNEQSAQAKQQKCTGPCQQKPVPIRRFPLRAQQSGRS